MTGMTGLPARRVRKAAAFAVAVTASGSLLTGCLGSGPLDVSCSDYLGKSSADQLHLAAQWAHPAHDGKTDPMSDVIAPDYRKRLVTYCRQSGHSGDKLSSLQLRYGYGN